MYPCKVLVIEPLHRWPHGVRSRAYQLVVVQYRDSPEQAEHERPFWMHADCHNACVEASRGLTTKQVAEAIYLNQAEIVHVDCFDNKIMYVDSHLPCSLCL